MANTLASPRLDGILRRLFAVAADDSTSARMAEYLEYVRDPVNGYVTVAFPVADGMEISSWTGR